MQPLPDIRSWRPDVDPEYAEMRVRWLREQILDADLAIEAQQRIIAADGPLDAYLMSIASLRSSQQAMESTLAVVIGNIGSEVWKHSSFGTKIAKAVEYRDNGVPIAIISESHWIAHMR